MYHIVHTMYYYITPFPGAPNMLFTGNLIAYYPLLIMDRPDGTILLSSDFKRIYLALGITKSIGTACDLSRRNSILEG